MTTNPWPEAPLEDRVVMLCLDHPNGVDRARISRRLRAWQWELERTLRQLVEQGWLGVEHPDGQPSRSSVYTVIESRPGLRERMQWWYVEHGFVRDEQPWARPVPPAQDPAADRIMALVAGVPSGATEAQAYRAWRLQAQKLWHRTLHLHDLMQDMYSAERRERARDIIHFPPEHRTKLPPATVPEGGGVRMMLELAVACREAAREDAWKARKLLVMASAAEERMRLFSRVMCSGENALAPLAAPMTDADYALRAGIRGARAVAFLQDEVHYGSYVNVGEGGDVAVAYELLWIAKNLDKLATQVLGHRKLASIVSTPAAAELLGEDVDLSPDMFGADDGAIDYRLPNELESVEFTTEPVIRKPHELRAGERIVALGEHPLSTTVDVVAGPDAERRVQLTATQGTTIFAMPVDLLETHDGLRVLERVGGPS